jgi:RimJ/RimL family protein N-acetyltransferase
MNFDLQPHLIGIKLELRPLRPEDFESLYAAASDPKIWEQHPEPNRYKREVFQGFFEKAIDSKGALAVIDLSTRSIVGSSRFYNFSDEKQEIEVGYTFLARSHWGGVFNREMKSLMLTHAFETVEDVIFHVGENNLRSRRALEKIGAEFSHKLETTGTDAVAKTNCVYRLNRKAFAL